MENKSRQVLDKITFISTIFNEEKSIINFMKSLLEQNCLPGEIIIVDGGSSDNTLKVIDDFFSEKAGINFTVIENSREHSDYMQVKNEEIIKDIFLSVKEKSGHKEKNRVNKESKLRLCLFSSPGSKIAEGRNIAISHASNEIICCSDGGCSLDKDWLYEISKFYFNDKKQFDVAGGYSHPVALTFLEKLLEMCIMPGVKEIDPERFMPSSRNISFLKSAWQEVGGYPQHLDYGEDMKFNFSLVCKGFKIAFNPEAVVYWRMRENLVSIFKQFFRYSKGDAIGRMYTYRHLIRFLSFFIFIALIILSIFVSPWVSILFIPLIIFYIYKPLLRLKDTWLHMKSPLKRIMLKISSILLAPFMLIFIDIAKAFGYVYGKIKRKA